MTHREVDEELLVWLLNPLTGAGTATPGASDQLLSSAPFIFVGGLASLLSSVVEMQEDMKEVNGLRWPSAVHVAHTNVCIR